VDFESLQKIFSIIILDLVLSGDNAVVIGMAARNLDPDNRRKAIVWGGVGAVGLRIFFTVLAALLLDVPLLQAIGGILLVVIAIRLISPGDSETNIASASSLGTAVKTIILADVVMSLDNILAVGGTAEGHLGLLIFGLGLSIPLLLLGSNVVASLLQRIPWLLILGVVILIHAAVSMLLHDHLVEDLIHYDAPEWVILAVAPLVAFVVIAYVRIRHGKVAGLGDTPAHTSNA
jgi:YjbE family integral membrane protein